MDTALVQCGHASSFLCIRVSAYMYVPFELTVVCLCVAGKVMEAAMRSFIKVLRKPAELDSRPTLKAMVTAILARRGWF